MIKKVFLLICLLSSYIFADSLYIKYIEEFYNNQNINMGDNLVLSQIITVNSGKNNDISISNVYSMDNNTSAVVLKNEYQEDQLLLFTNGGSWMYKEGLRKPIKISNSLSIIGSLNISDILGLKLLDDYIVDSERVSEQSYIIDLESIKDELSYPFISVVIDKDEKILKKLILMGEGKRPVKEVVFSEYKVVNKKHKFPVWEIRDLIFNNSTISTIEYMSVSTHKLKKSLFQPNRQALSTLYRLTN